VSAGNHTPDCLLCSAGQMAPEEEYTVIYTKLMKLVHKLICSHFNKRDLNCCFVQICSTEHNANSSSNCRLLWILRCPAFCNSLSPYAVYVIKMIAETASVLR